MGQYPEVENGVRVVVPQLGPESGGPETDFQSPPKVRLDSGGLRRTTNYGAYDKKKIPHSLLSWYRTPQMCMLLSYAERSKESDSAYNVSKARCVQTVQRVVAVWTVSNAVLVFFESG